MTGDAMSTGPMSDYQPGDGRLFAEIDKWRYVADTLAEELRKWGWGDFHYGDQGQEQSVLDALAVYEQATDSGGRPAS